MSAPDDLRRAHGDGAYRLNRSPRPPGHLSVPDGFATMSVDEQEAVIDQRTHDLRRELFSDG